LNSAVKTAIKVEGYIWSLW